MDAYLSQEAFKSLSALSLISSSSNSDGFLIGHKRGHRFFVEKIFSSVNGFFPSLKKYHELDQFYDGKLIGFFSFKPEKIKIKKILAPFACGKLFLELSLSQRNKMRIKSYIIDYKDEFFIFPIKLKHHQ